VHSSYHGSDITHAEVYATQHGYRDPTRKATNIRPGGFLMHSKFTAFSASSIETAKRKTFGF